MEGVEIGGDSSETGLVTKKGNKNQRLVSVPVSRRTTGIKGRATNTAKGV